MKKTKIICTVGPATDDKDILVEMMKNGMDVARFNFSHGNYEEHIKRMNLVKEAAAEAERFVALLLDTKGPEIRTGAFKDNEDGGAYRLEAGQEYILTTRELEGDGTICSISYQELPHDIKQGDKILIDDGLVEMTVTSISETDIKCQVHNEGVIKSHKGVNVPGVRLNLPALTQKDYDDIIVGIENDVDFIAASFVRKASDIAQIRGILEIKKASHIKIIAKIENNEGIKNVKEIIEAADGLMVARGDLGVEIPAEQIPMAQKNLIKLCNYVGKPVITATQMLDSMIRNPRPTRAEVTDVANAIFDGTDAIMLSGETAAGKYPVEAVETMTRIALNAEGALDYKSILMSKATLKDESVTDAISHAACTCSRDLKTKAILTATTSGYTARMIAKFRPEADIYASTAFVHIARQLCIIWGVTPLITRKCEDDEIYLKVFELGLEACQEKKYIEPGEMIVITAGVPTGRVGHTNMMRAYRVGDAFV